MWGDLTLPLCVCVFPQLPGGLWLTTNNWIQNVTSTAYTVTRTKTHWRTSPPIRMNTLTQTCTHTYLQINTHTQKKIKRHPCVWKQQGTETMAASFNVPLSATAHYCATYVKGRALPYSQFIGFKVTDFLQCKSPTFLIASSPTCAMFSFFPAVFVWCHSRRTKKYID